MTDKSDILERLNVTNDDITDIAGDMPSDKCTIDKNAYLINHIKDHHEKDVPSDVRKEMYETLMGMTNLKLLENSNLFTYMMCDEVLEDSNKLMESVLAMHGIVTKLLCKFGDEIAEHLSDKERGILNVLFFGRTTETLPTKDEILDIMREFNECSTLEKSDTDLAHAMLPTLVKGIHRKVDDMMEQACSTGIYATSRDDKVIKTAVSERLLRRLFLPLQSGNGVYAVKLCDTNAKSKVCDKLKDEMMELINKVGDMGEEEFKTMVKDMIDEKAKKERN